LAQLPRLTRAVLFIEIQSPKAETIVLRERDGEMCAAGESRELELWGLGKILRSSEAALRFDDADVD